MKANEAIDIFLKNRDMSVAMETSKWYRRYAQPLREYGERELSEITLVDLQILFQKLSERRRYSRYTLANYIRAWKYFFCWAVDQGLLASNPAKKIPRLSIPPKTPSAVSDPDIEILLRYAGQTRFPERDQALLSMLVDTGARVGGIANLQTVYLDIKKRRAIVAEKGRGGKKERVVFFSPTTAQALQRWINVRPQTDDDRLFLLTEVGIYQVLKRLARTSKIKGRWNPHSFRHAFARRMLAKGMSVGIVSHLMGHSNVNVTISFYGRFSNDELQKIYDEFSGRAEAS